MNDLDDIKGAAANLGINLAGEIIPIPSNERHYFLPIHVHRMENGRHSPSGFTLSALRRDLQDIGLHIEYLAINDENMAMEAGLRTSLINSFPDLVRNSFLSIEGKVAHAWIEKKRPITPEDESRLRNHIQQYSTLFSLDSAQLHVTSDELVATKLEFLQIVRQLSPTGCDEVYDELIKRGFSVPSLEWVNHRFDTLRRSGLLLRIRDRHYSLTLAALHRLGTTKNKRSPDVTRLLALARRGG